MAETNRQQSRRYLTLTLGGEFFAIEIHMVREILDFTEITRIPQTPASMRGVVNVRGSAVPVVDLGVKLGLGEVVHTIHTRIVIVEIRHGDTVSLMGVLADSVKEVLELDAAAIAPPPSLGAAVEVACLEGIGRHEGRFILLLNVDRVFGTSEVLDIARAMADPAAAFADAQSAA